MIDLTAKQIANMLGCSKRCTTKRAQDEAWPIAKTGPRGQLLFSVTDLPSDIQIALAEKQQTAAAEAGKLAAEKILLSRALEEQKEKTARRSGLAKLAEMSDRHKQAAYTKTKIVEACTRFAKANQLHKKPARAAFCSLYAQGELASIYIDKKTKELIPSLSVSTLLRWQKQLKAEGVASLAGKKLGQTRSIIEASPEIKELVMGILVKYPHSSAQHIQSSIKIRFGNVCSLRAVQRFLAKWKEDNKQVFTSLSNPDVWRSRYRAAGGNASADILRLNQVWEFDSTKADIMLSDNKRHVIVGCISVYTRRLKFHVSRSSSSMAVASLLKKAIIDWGVPEIIVTDNGSDYVSKHIAAPRLICGLPT